MTPEFQTVKNNNEDCSLECCPVENNETLVCDISEVSEKEQLNLLHLQKIRTKEPSSLDLIKSSNYTLRKLLRIARTSTDLYHLIMDAVRLKDKEIVRLRRKLIQSQNMLAATKRNVIPRLVSKAAEVRVLKEEVSAFELLFREARMERFAKKSVSNEPESKVVEPKVVESQVNKSQVIDKPQVIIKSSGEKQVIDNDWKEKEDSQVLPITKPEEVKREGKIGIPKNKNKKVLPDSPWGSKQWITGL